MKPQWESGLTEQLHICLTYLLIFYFFKESSPDEKKYQGTMKGRNLEVRVKDKVLGESDIFTKEREDWDIFTSLFSSLGLVSDPAITLT